MNTTHTPSTAVIGCGKGGKGVGGHSIGHRHAQVYDLLGYPIVGACDLNPENLKNFTETYSVPHAHESLTNMLQTCTPNLVSICTYVGSHLSILQECVDAGVKAVFMEKPLCLSMQEGEEMIRIAETAGVHVVVNHYRRYLSRFQQIKAKLDSGAIGEPVLYVAGIDGWDLMEWGTHWLDMFRYFADDQPVEWVMGQADVTDRFGYGHVMEDHALAYVGFADGSKALLDGGKGFKGDIAMRIIGTEGLLEIPGSEPVYTLTAEGKQEFAEGTNIHGDPEFSAWKLLLKDLQQWQEGGPEPQCSIRNALASSELYLAAYESAMNGGSSPVPLSARSDAFPLQPGTT